MTVGGNRREADTFHITDARRWGHGEAYSPGWEDRNSKMLDIYLRHHSANYSTTFTEYGCGPRRPFTGALLLAGFRNIVQYDLNVWEHGNAMLDLNGDWEFVSRTDVGVFSGVLEYINDLPSVLGKICKFHNYLLLSYTSIAFALSGSDGEYISAVNTRCATHGWRNHLDLNQFVNTLSSAGYLEAIEPYGQQVIALVRTTASCPPRTRKLKRAVMPRWLGRSNYS